MVPKVTTEEARVLERTLLLPNKTKLKDTPIGVSPLWVQSILGDVVLDWAAPFFRRGTVVLC